MSQRRSRTLWILCCALVLCVAYQIKHIRFVAPKNSIILNNAVFQTANNHPTLSIPTKRRLPDNWQWHSDKSSYGRYTIEFDATPDQQDVWAILIPTVRSNARVMLNGEFIGDGGSFEAPISSNLRRPLFFSVSPSLFRPNKNVLQIELKSSVIGKGFLDSLVIGPYAELELAYQRHYFFRISLVESITYSLLIMSALMALLARLRPRNSEYGWFALASLLWAAHNATNHITDVIWSNHFWDWFSYTTLGWFALVAPIVLLRFKQRYAPLCEKLILSTALTVPLVMLLLSQPSMHLIADYIWYPIALSVGGSALLLVSIDAWKTNDIESQLLVASGLFIIPYAIHDLLVVMAILPWQDGYYIQFGAVILLAVFAAILLYRLAASSNEAERLNQNLSLEVTKKTEEIRNAMDHTRALEKDKWLSAERARITRDMHDGVAGQIVSTISSLQKGKLSESDIQAQLEYCINDIRLMIDSLDNEDDDLISLLGMFRFRITPMLEQAGVELKWQALPIETKANLTPSTSLHLLRILQESVHNAIRHANCSSLSVKACLSSGLTNTLTISLEDNGIGMSEEIGKQQKISTQRGLKNMRYRAEQIEGTLSINSLSSGTQVTLTMPIDPSHKL